MSFLLFFFEMSSLVLSQSLCNVLAVAGAVLTKTLSSVGTQCVLPTIQVITNLVKMVKARDIRRPFCPAGHWLSEEVNIRADKVLSRVRGGKTYIHW